MKAYFEKLLRCNFRFGRMLGSRTVRLAGRSFTPMEAEDA